MYSVTFTNAHKGHSSPLAWPEDFCRAFFGERQWALIKAGTFTYAKAAHI